MQDKSCTVQRTIAKQCVSYQVLHLLPAAFDVFVLIPVAAVLFVLQVGAELRAAAVFGAVLEEPSPLMALMLDQSADSRGSTFVYPYAGPSAEHMLDTHWANLTRQQREPLCKKLAISALKVIQLLESVVRYSSCLALY